MEIAVPLRDVRFKGVEQAGRTIYQFRIREDLKARPGHGGGRRRNRKNLTRAQQVRIVEAVGSLDVLRPNSESKGDLIQRVSRSNHVRVGRLSDLRRRANRIRRGCQVLFPGSSRRRQESG